MMEKLIVKQAYTGEILAELEMHNAPQVQQMLSTAQARHKAGRLPEIQRIEILQKLADLVAAEHEDFSRLIANEGGKPIRDARVEVTRAISGIRIAMMELGNIKGEEIPMDYTPAGVGHKAYTILEPIGVVVAVSAFNHPLNLAIHQVIPAIASGCPVIIKPASLTPLCTLRLAVLIQKAGLPAIASSTQSSILSVSFADISGPKSQSSLIALPTTCPAATVAIFCAKSCMRFSAT
jgi:acyl-CoA reductase-like NAD-dependent aldehyde dehydrogenase